MKRKFIIGLIVILLLMSSIAFAQGFKEKIEVMFNAINLQVNGIPVNADNILYNGTTYVPLRAIAEMLDKEVIWDGETYTAKINNRSVEQQETTENISSKEKDIITKADLPYTINAKNGMSLKINSYTASKRGIKFNLTLTNNSSVSDKGQKMISVYEIYDGKETLKFISMDDIFYDVHYLRAGQSVTGDVVFQGLSHDASTFTLYGGLWQYIDREEFKITFKVEWEVI